jgi:hypothetical protein
MSMKKEETKKEKSWAVRSQEEMRRKYLAGEVIIPAVKFCLNCSTEKKAEEFLKDTRKKDGLSFYCRDCVNLRVRLDHAKNPEKYRQRKKRYRKNNPEKVKADSRKECLRYKKRRDEYRKEYMSRPEVREDRRKKNLEYLKKKRKEDLIFRLIDGIRGRIRGMLRGYVKSAPTLVLLGCSIEELKEYLSSQFYPNPETGEEMTWNNYKKYIWNIDHIFPVNSFDFNDPEAQFKAFHVSNLQPLWYDDHLEKHRKWGDCRAPEGVTLESLMAKYLKWKEEYDKSNS